MTQLAFLHEFFTIFTPNTEAAFLAKSYFSFDFSEAFPLGFLVKCSRAHSTSLGQKVG
jgi:hypothetical protein